MKCDCIITDVKLDKVNKNAIVGVEVAVNGVKSLKAFKVDAQEMVNFEQFRVKLLEKIIADIKEEGSMEKNISELTKRKGISFKLDIDKVV
jgi:hypothetical protein